jgi:hypothetical protein
VQLGLRVIYEVNLYMDETSGSGLYGNSLSLFRRFATAADRWHVFMTILTNDVTGMIISREKVN